MNRSVLIAGLLLILPLLHPACAGDSPSVLTGADRVVAARGAMFGGKRVGLITNHTAVLADGRHLVDGLLAAGVRVTALFGPEHGIRGLAEAGDTVHDSIDPGTGIPVFSLYGATSQPSPAMLAQVDVLVYDIQDVGARFYTYISTMKLCMEAAAEQGLPFVVLDRPNPLGALVDGPVIEDSLRSFVGIVPVPVAYGLTAGELAVMINERGWLAGGARADLEVVWMEGWTRAARLTTSWVAPSPNIKWPETVDLYPGTCLIEAANVSEGRGTDRPFHMMGAPWIDGDRWADRMNAEGLPGVRFGPTRFTPQASKHRGIPCSGIVATVTDREAFKPLLTGIALLVTLRELYPDSLAIRRASLNRLLGQAGAYDAIHRGETAAAIESSWQDGLAAYRDSLARFRHYPLR